MNKNIVVTIIKAIADINATLSVRAKARKGLSVSTLEDTEPISFAMWEAVAAEPPLPAINIV